MFFCLINNYVICYREPAVTARDNLAANEIFDFGKYLSFFDEQRRPFMAEFCKTQSFTNFIERSYKARFAKNEVTFFFEGVKLCATQGERALAARVKRITSQLLERNKNVSCASLSLSSSQPRSRWTSATSCT